MIPNISVSFLNLSFDKGDIDYKIDAMTDAARNLYETINNLKGQTG
jgi:hypothetical protein